MWEVVKLSRFERDVMTTTVALKRMKHDQYFKLMPPPRDVETYLDYITVQATAGSERHHTYIRYLVLFRSMQLEAVGEADISIIRAITFCNDKKIVWCVM